MHIIPTAVKLALVHHTNNHPADIVFAVKANIGGGGVTVTFAPDKTGNDRNLDPCVTATYFISIEEVRSDGAQRRI